MIKASVIIPVHNKVKLFEMHKQSGYIRDIKK